MELPEDRAAPTLCLGEAIVDLICEDVVDSPTQASSFRPHFGGALANVAVAIARGGGSAALAAGVGEDAWGAWLRDRLRVEGVELDRFRLVAGMQTPLAFVTFDRNLEPTFRVYGDGIVAGMHAIDGQVETAVASADALVFGSNTLIGEPERELTLRARDLALERGIPVVLDPNLRPNRWQDLEIALERCRSVCADAFMVRANLEEARRICGLGPGLEPADAAEGLCGLGARHAVVTVGAEGALLRGDAEGKATAPTVEVVAPLGAGDAFLGTLIAAASRGGWDPEAVAGGLAEACAAGARACESWGALG